MFELAFTAAPTPTALVSLDGRITKVNPALCKLMARQEGELIGRTFQDMTHPEDLDVDGEEARPVPAGGYRVDRRFVRPCGETVWTLFSMAPARDMHGTPVWFVAQIVDVSPSKVAEQQLRHEAAHDALTQLWNRARLLEELERCVTEHRRYGEPAALMLIDLDGFKAVNDTFGHEAGDCQLRAAAAAITDATRDSDRCGRLGGDEFVALLPHTDEEAATIVGDRIVAAIAAVTGPHGHRCAIGASVGLAVLDDSVTCGDAWLRQADRAMYRAKRAGGSRVMAVST